MMNRSPILAAAMLACSGVVGAQTTSDGLGQLQIVGQAPSACIVRGPLESTTATNATYLPKGSSGAEIRITEMVDLRTARGRAATIDLAIGVVCNSPHHMMLHSLNGGLLRDGAGPRTTRQGGFTEFIPYRVAANWLGRNVGSSSDGAAPLAIHTRTGGAGQLSLSISVPGGAPLLAGTYRDSVVVEFSAAE